MASPVRVRVLGEGPAARGYLEAIAASDGLDLVTGSGATALILADDHDPQGSMEASSSSSDTPVLIDPGALISTGPSERSRAWFRSFQQPALVALPWRSAPVVQLARSLLDAPRFLHAHVTVSSNEPTPMALFHLLDLITHLMDRSPDRVYAEAGGGAALDLEAPAATAVTLSFGTHGSAAFQISGMDGPLAAPAIFLQLTDGSRRMALTGFLASAEVAGFDDEQIEAALPPELLRVSDRPDSVRSDWDLSQGRAAVLEDLAKAARTGEAPKGAPDLPSALRTAALVRATLATQESGTPRRLVTR